jgi:hypothetical protein
MVACAAEQSRLADRARIACIVSAVRIAKNEAQTPQSTQARVVCDIAVVHCVCVLAPGEQQGNGLNVAIA